MVANGNGHSKIVAFTGMLEMNAFYLPMLKIAGQTPKHMESLYRELLAEIKPLKSAPEAMAQILDFLQFHLKELGDELEKKRDPIDIISTLMSLSVGVATGINYMDHFVKLSGVDIQIKEDGCGDQHS